MNQTIASRVLSDAMLATELRQRLRSMRHDAVEALIATPPDMPGTVAALQAAVRTLDAMTELLLGDRK